MKRSKADVETLIAELEFDRAQLGLLFETNSRAQSRILHGAKEDLDYAALGYTLHNLYGVIENACFRIAKFFENGLSPTSWHRDLLDRMLLTISAIRPAFFERDEHALLDELRALRHVFRNFYSRPLDTDRLLLLQNKVPLIQTAVFSAFDRYHTFLNTLKDSIEAS